MKKLILSAVMLSGITIHGAIIDNQSSSEWTAKIQYRMPGLDGDDKTITINIKPGQTKNYDFFTGVRNVFQITLVGGGSAGAYLYKYGNHQPSLAPFPNTHGCGIDINIPQHGDIQLHPCDQ